MDKENYWLEKRKSGTPISIFASIVFLVSCFTSAIAFQMFGGETGLLISKIAIWIAGVAILVCFFMAGRSMYYDWRMGNSRGVIATLVVFLIFLIIGYFFISPVFY